MRPALDEVETTEHLSIQQSASDRLCATSELAEQIKFLRASGCLDATPPTCKYRSGPLQSPIPTPEWGPGTKLRGDGGGGGDGRVRVWEVRQW